MREITVDLRGFLTEEELHENLAGLFGFPEYYGKNLDALYDMLTDSFEDTRVSVRLPGNGEADAEDARAEWRIWYAARVLRVFKDAERENRHLYVKVLEKDGASSAAPEERRPCL